MNHRNIARYSILLLLALGLLALVIGSLQQPSRTVLRPGDAYQDAEVVATQYQQVLANLANEGLLQHRVLSQQLAQVAKNQPQAHPRARNNVGVVARVYERLITDAQRLQLPQPLLPDSAKWEGRRRALLQGLQTRRQAIELARQYLENPQPAKQAAYLALASTADSLLQPLAQGADSPYLLAPGELDSALADTALPPPPGVQ